MRNHATVSDLDFFSFTTTGGAVSLDFTTVSRHGNLDILVTLFDGGGNVLSTYNPAGLEASYNGNLAAGTYYVSVDGTGEGSPLVTGYSDYGSIGSFFIRGTVPVSGAGNVAPIVAITAPTTGTDFTSPASVTITASASDADGTVSKVEFFVDGTKVGESATVPYSYVYTQSAVGSYSLTAVATDNEVGSATSVAVNVTVSSGGGNTCTAPAWDAATSYSGGAQVSYNNVVYEAKWWTMNNQPDLFSGSYDQWKVIGPCEGGENIDPTVILTNPLDGTAFTTGDVVSLSATATDTDGTIDYVEFFIDGVLIGGDVTATYSVNYTMSSVGNYSVFAIATDNEGVVTT
jgi:chitodextrinase